MNLYSIRWYSNGQKLLVGGLESIMALANMLETGKIHFKVADCSGFILSQTQLGVGGFEYWLGPDVEFD